MANSHVLVRLDRNVIPPGEHEIRAFVPVRNERSRLPYFLEYHRKLGVDRFFVVENASSDDTLDYLLSQPDCHVFVTKDSFAEANFGIAWMNTLLDLYGTNRWCLTIDADELFTYPGCETTPLGDFARQLDARKARGVFAFLLDMYGNKSIADSVYVSGEPFTNACPFFDHDYVWRKRPRLPFQSAPWPAFEIDGGPRLRCFYPERCNMSFVRLNLMRIALRCKLRLVTAPALTKIPFVKWQGARYLTNHRTTRLPLAEVTAVLLHFKFMSDFHSRVVNESSRREHYNNGSEYARYLARLQHEPKLSLFYERSVAYQSSQQLVKMGLMRLATPAPASGSIAAPAVDLALT